MRRGAAGCAPVLAGAMLLLAGPAAAQEGVFGGMQKGVETVFSSVSTTNTFASGAVTKTETLNFFPALTLNLDAMIYPNLRLNTGGVWEVSMASVRSNGSETNSTIGRNRPFFLLRSTNPVFSPGFGYFRREDRARVAGLSNVKFVNDEYAAYLGWNPGGGPQSEFQFLRTFTYDDKRAYQDLRKDYGSLISNYSFRNLGGYYRGFYLKSDDRLQDFDTEQVSHAARVNYSGTFIAKRLLWNATYNINRLDVTTIAAGNAGEVALPVTPFAGLSSVSDLPSISALSPNSSLIDANLAAGAGIDIGLPASPADSQLRNIGLDLLDRTEVNRLLIWLDRDLPVEVANSFSWEIYSSADNVTWQRESTVAMAPFGPFEARFQVDFPSVTARYIKVVTRPLSAVVPDSSRFPDIFVTEIQAFLRRPAGDLNNRLTQVNHTLNSDVRLRILNVPQLYYEGFYLHNGPDAFGGPSTETLSNGVSLSHTFSRIFSVYVRGAREQGTERRGHRTATLTNATLTVDPLPTLRSSLLYTGQDEELAGLPSVRRGFFLQNFAQPYRGVDLQFGVGWNSTTHETGEMSRDRLLNTSVTITPRQHVSVTLSYDDTTGTRSGTFVGNPETYTRRLYAAVAVDPVPTLHLVLGEEIVATTDQKKRTTFDVGVNWSPFPDGTLQFILAANQAVRDPLFGNDRSSLGAVRWNLSRRSFVDVSYQRTRSEFVNVTSESRIFSVSVRLFF